MKKTNIIAHRGASFIAPENTMAAFEKAAEFGSDGIEFDVSLSLDQQVVVIHDDTVDRTTNGSGNVYDIPFSELVKLDAGSYFSKKFMGEPIPSLKLVLDTYRDSFKLINIELKKDPSQKRVLSEKVVEIVKKCNCEDKILFSSFFPGNLRRIQELLPEANLGLLVLPGVSGVIIQGLAEMMIKKTAIHPYYEVVNQRRMKKYKKYYTSINTWTVNTAIDIKRMIKMDVDGLITDNPVLALGIRNEN
ncbi:MAG: hypothetical protein JEZ06_17250 [Anaerolineaceae bacterium]|nr:hypothetical protein [Anaerolineaceae bacterium]